MNKKLLEDLNKAKSAGIVLNLIEKATGEDKPLDWGIPHCGDFSDCDERDNSTTVFANIHHSVQIYFTAVGNGSNDFMIYISNTKKEFKITGDIWKFESWQSVKNWRRATMLFDQFYTQAANKLLKVLHES